MTVLAPVAISPVEDIVADMRTGRIVILVDEEDRENEGDLVLAADHVTADAINFMARFGRGLICLTLTRERCERLQLPPMTVRNGDKKGTAFTVSIEAAEGVTTGISAADRACTVQAAVAPNARADDLVQPGHIFPLRARDGGTLVRTGQTEGSVDLCKIAGVQPAAVICEIMKDDGSMARLPDLVLFAQKHSLKIVSVADIARFRLLHERIIKRVSGARMPTFAGYFDVHVYTSLADGGEHLALCHNVQPSDLRGNDDYGQEPILVRVHSECLTGDVFGSARCDCGSQLHTAMLQVQKEKRGAIIYLHHASAQIGLIEKIKAYALQDQGYDTVEANVLLGHKPDQREYGTGSQILNDLGIKKLRLLTNNPSKRSAISAYGLEIVERVGLEMPPTEENNFYMRTKREKMGHILELPKDSNRHKKA